MTSFQRPADDRHDGMLAAYEQPCRDSEAGATCPLLERKVQLLPLRYGIVEELIPGIGMPYTLEARPLGIRLPRNGYLYVLDASNNSIKEYEFRNQGNTISGKLEYQTDRTLYVSFSEVPWTERKRDQVRNSTKDRDAFMQMVDLSGANPITGGGAHLITTAQAEQWVAEFAEDAQLDVVEEGHEQESEPYHWENEPYYHKTRLGKLLKQHRVADRDECLCLILRDDLGVMRDLANHQDHVVDWIDAWANENDGRTERDYLLGCYIESLSQIDPAALEGIRQIDDDPRVQAMWEDLDAMQDPERSDAKQALLDFLNRDSHSGELPSPSDPNLPPALKARLARIREGATRANAYGIAQQLNATVHRYYVEQSLEAALGEAFVAKHGDALLQLKKRHNERLKALLEGDRIGQRGINELVDRERMDAFLARQRTKLQRWNTLLDALSADRVDMLCHDRFHMAAWYFDPRDDSQVHEGFKAQYGCLKDICRSDRVTKRLAAWLEGNAHYDRPLFHTLPLAEQADLAGQYTTILNAGYGLLLRTRTAIEQLRAIEADHLPAVNDLPESTQAIADSALQALDPALSRGIAQVMEEFYQGIGSHRIPDLDALFRRLPRALPARILDAAQREGAMFVVASAEELASFRRTLQRVLGLREHLDRVRRQRDRVKRTAGHRSSDAQALLAEFKRLRHELQAVHEPALARALSPVSEVSEQGIRVAGATPGRAGLTLVLPAGTQAEVGRLVSNFRQGIAGAPRANLVGDGLGLLVFVTQVSTLLNTYKEYKDSRGTSNALTILDLAKTFAATSSAGFLAAQGIIDTALGAREKALSKALNAAGAQSVATSLGKLHVFLGLGAYGLGIFTSYQSFQNRHGDWQEAVRSGNQSAQHAAMASVLGVGGMLGANAYGLANTLHSLRQVIFEGVEWAAAGARLSTVFARFNLAGALFTVLELGGSWLYNYYSTSRHDDWLLGTPWSRDPETKTDASLHDYQHQLQALAQAPKISVSIEDHDSWWKAALTGPKSITLALSSPAISVNDLLAPLGGQARARLSLAGYQVQPEYHGRNYVPEYWIAATDEVTARLDMAEEVPLVLRFTLPEPASTPYGRRTRDLVIAIRLEFLNDDGQYQSHEYHIRVTPHGGEGDYTPSEVAIRGRAAPWYTIDPLFLTS